MNRPITILIAIASLAITQFSGATGYHVHERNKIDVMTMNQYLGADLAPIVNAQDQESLNAALLQVLESIATNDFPARADELARVIAKRSPELVGLQEVFYIDCTDLGPPLGPPADEQGCDDPRIRNAFNNQLDLTLVALAGRQNIYEEVATVVNIDTRHLFILPFPFSGIPLTIYDEFGESHQILVNFYDRDVILAREDVANNATPVDFEKFQPFGICKKPSLDGCNYQVVAKASLPNGIRINIERGFVGVDINIDGTDFRFFNTHLERQEPEDGNPLSSIIQAAQSEELLYTINLIEQLESTTSPARSLIVMGDINSSPDDQPIEVPLPIPPGFPAVIIPPYLQLAGWGTDAWTMRPGNRPGYTCCQEKDLLNRKSEHDKRIDVIFSFDTPDRVRKARVLGSRIWNKTRPPGPRRWPSDHGSVAAELQF